MFVKMRVQTVDIAKQQAITQDNVPVLVNGVIFFKVIDPEAAALKVENYWQAICRLAQATLRDVVGKLSLDELLSHQERLEAEIARNVEAASKAWGLHVEAIKLEDIDVPEELKKMMCRQASSEREKRATIIKADGDRQAAAALAEAAATMAASPGRDAAPRPADDRRPRPLGVEHRGARRPARDHRVDARVRRLDKPEELVAGAAEADVRAGFERRAPVAGGRARVDGAREPAAAAKDVARAGRGARAAREVLDVPSRGPLFEVARHVDGAER